MAENMSFISKGGMGDAWLSLLKIAQCATTLDSVSWIHAARRLNQVEGVTEMMTLVPKIRYGKCLKPGEELREQGRCAVKSSILGLDNPFLELEIKPYNSEIGYAVVQPYAGNSDAPRHFSPSALIELTAGLASMDLDVALLGGKFAFDGSKRLTNLTGRTSIRTSLQILKGARYFVGHYGFLAYAAMSLRVPSLVLFDSSNKIDGKIHCKWKPTTRTLVAPTRTIDASEILKEIVL